MFEYLSGIGRRILDPVLELYRDTDFAYGVAVLMMVLTAVIVAIAVIGHLIQVVAIKAKLRQIAGFIALGQGASSGADSKEEQFAHRFREIDAAMSRSGGMGGGLAHAWRRYRKTLVVGGRPPIRSSQRPNSFFYSAVTPPTWLGFTAAMLVGFGLLVTFLGLVAALTFASAGMASPDETTMQIALRDLLGAASSKFITSVAGVGLSLVLRIVERMLVVDLRGNVDRLSASIELGIRVDPDANGAALSEQISALIAEIRQPVRA